MRLQTFLAEQNAKEARLKQQRAPKRRNAGTQCDTDNVVPPRPQTSDAAVQTDSIDVMDELKQQVRSLTQIVAELTALKAQRPEEARPCPGPMLSELLSDLPGMYQDSDENSGISATENLLPGLSDFPASSPVTRPPSGSSSPANLPSRPPLTTIQQNIPPVNYRSYGPTDEQRRKVEAITFMGSQMSTTALACVDVLFSEAELVNGNTGGTFGYNKLDEHKLGFLVCAAAKV